MKNPLTRAEVERIRDLVTIHPQVRDLATTALALEEQRDNARFVARTEATRADTAESRIRALEEGLQRIEASCAGKPERVLVASGEIQTAYRMDGGTMRELRSLLTDKRSSVLTEALRQADRLADYILDPSLRRLDRGPLRSLAEAYRRALLTERADGEGGAE